MTISVSKCEIWWGRVALTRPEHIDLLDSHQRQRMRRLVRGPDRDRLLVAAALGRLVVGRELGCEPQVVRFDRTCPTCGGPHGKPMVVGGDGLELSVSHSGGWVAVAVANRPIGVDVEEHRTGIDSDDGIDDDELLVQMLSPAERSVMAAVPRTARRQAVLRYWTRKEAVLKATGEGLRVPMNVLTVSPPSQPAALRHWRGRPGMAQRVRIFDLSCSSNYSANVAMLDAASVTIRELDGAALLRLG